MCYIIYEVRTMVSIIELLKELNELANSLILRILLGHH